jgi:AGZA family xanthine/uracil permease-like MFS transporter
MDGFFRLTERGTTLRREIVGGATTFAAMAYIVVVNPAILAFAGLPTGPSTIATIVTAAFGTLLMGLYANRPIAVAPYMGENAFLAFGLAALGITWQQRLGAVFVSGLAFLVLTLVGFRGALATAIPTSLKHAFAVGIGLFLALIGLYETGVVTSAVTGLPAAALLVPGSDRLAAPAVPLKIGDLHQPTVLLALLGFVVTLTLLARRVRGAILIGIAVTAALGLALGHGAGPKALVAMPFTGGLSLAPIALQLDVAGVLRLSLLPVLLTLFLMGLLDTLGTLVGVGAAGGMLDAKGEFPQIEKPMLVDALTCVFSGLVGTSTSGAYIESATGIGEGARTGLAAVVTAALFLVSLFFVPLFEPLQALRYAYAPALIAVGVLMLGQARAIDFDDLTEAGPAFASLAMMVFTYSIANGLTAGLVLHPALKALTGRAREVRPGGWVLAALCLTYYLFGLPH